MNPVTTATYEGFKRTLEVPERFKEAAKYILTLLTTIEEPKPPVMASMQFYRTSSSGLDVNDKEW